MLVVCPAVAGVLGILPVSASASPRPRLLIVDDDAEVLRALTFLAQTEGFEVEGRCNARAAIEGCVSGEPFACLIIDQMLPDLPGVDLLDQLRRRGVSAPAVLITTAPSSALRRLALQAGAPIVEKPLLHDTLLQAVRSAINGLDRDQGAPIAGE